MATLVKRIENVERAAQAINDSDEVSRMSKAERAARIAELTPRFLERINREGLSADLEHRQRQERIIELIRRRDAGLSAQEVTNESL